MKIVESNFADFTITTDRRKMNVNAIHNFLSNYSGWSENISIENVKASIGNSLNFGVF